VILFASWDAYLNYMGCILKLSKTFGTTYRIPWGKSNIKQ